MRDIVGICGTPGTGKKTVAPKVSELLGLAGAISINSLAPQGSSEVDPKQLRKALLKSKPAHVVLYGHLLPYLLKKEEAGFVAVLRCDPAVLRKRLVARRYPSSKVTENVEAELIGVLLYDCVKEYGDDLVREYDTTAATPEDVANAIARDARDSLAGKARRSRKAKAHWIDWTLNYGSSSKLRSLFPGGKEPPGST